MRQVVPFRLAGLRQVLAAFDFDAATVHLHPSRGHPDLVIPQDIVGDSVPVRTAIRPRVFERSVEAPPHDDVEGDRGVLGCSRLTRTARDGSTT